MAKNFEWFHSHHEILKQEFESQYVTFKDRKLLDSDNDVKRLEMRPDCKSPEKSLTIEFVNIIDKSE